MKPTRSHVEWFRSAAPYIHAHRGQTFVIQFAGEAAQDERLVHDIALLNSLGVRLVLVFGSRPQIETQLARTGRALRYVNGLRITDSETLEVVREAVGSVQLQLQALLSMGLPNSPMAGAQIRVVSGNFVVARPIGVRDGTDYCNTGEVRRVDADSLRVHLEQGAIVLVAPIGFSRSGELFNLYSEQVATEIAISLHAAKLIVLAEEQGLRDRNNVPIRDLTVAEASALAKEMRPNAGNQERQRRLEAAIRACRNGVRRTHLLERGLDGALLLELFTRDGVGTMVSADAIEMNRRATVEDVGGILELIGPLEKQGTLVRRSRERLELEIGDFQVMDRDGTIIACAATHYYAEPAMAELACLAVRSEYRHSARGAAMLRAAEMTVRARGAEALFVLTTQAEHWFVEQGFRRARVTDLPIARQNLYNYQRGSKVLIKSL